MTDAPNRRRSHSIDDDAVPTSLVSPSKAKAQQQQRPLLHSRSSADLTAIQETALGTESAPETPRKSSDTKRSSATPKRPSAFKLRRRSTLDWINASPQARQQKLEDTVGKRTADVFFTLHVQGLQDPIHVSEVAEKTMNPTFRFFDLSTSGAYVTRALQLQIKVWARNDQSRDFQYLLELEVALNDLRFLGKTLESVRVPLPANCVLFHIAGGIYANTGGSRGSSSTQASRPRGSIPRELPTSSYDALMRLSTLDDCIRDALETRAKLEREIGSIIDEHRQDLETVQATPVVSLHTDEVKQALLAQRKRVQAAKLHRDELKHDLQQRRQIMLHDREHQSRVDKEMREGGITIDALHESATSTADDIRKQRRRITDALATIYPIEPIPNKALHFTIRGSYLPNSDFERIASTDEDTIAAALGHVSHIVHHLSYYLSIPIPYPVNPRSSLSTISDPISTTPTPISPIGVNLRMYPLYPAGVPKFRFEYAVFLLNKNIEILLNRLGLRVIDLRQTLPNLKYLLYITTAGEGELPLRRAGGIRAFLKGGPVGAGGLLTPPIMSRTASSDSHSSAIGPSPLGINGRLNGFANGKGGAKDEVVAASFKSGFRSPTAAKYNIVS